MNNNKFKVDEKEYSIIKILAPSNSNNKYIIYTDETNEYYASKYEVIDGNIVLKDIEEEEEWNYIDKRMEELLNGK